MIDDTSPPTPPAPPPPRLLDQLRQATRERGHPEPTVAAFADWNRRFILFHGKRHPRDMGAAEVGQFLDSVARTEQDPVPAIAASRDALDRPFQFSTATNKPDEVKKWQAERAKYPEAAPVSGEKK